MAQKVRFTHKAVRKHLELRHPACPESIRKEIVARVRKKTWDCSIGRAVGISMHSYARHELTDYDKLYLIPGLTKEAARLIIKDEVNHIISRWQTLPDENSSTEPTKEDDAQLLGKR